MGWGEPITPTPKPVKYVTSLQSVVDAARTWAVSPTLRNEDLMRQAVKAHDNEWNPF